MIFIVEHVTMQNHSAKLYYQKQINTISSSDEQTLLQKFFL